MFSTNFKSIYDLMKTFPDEQSCIDYLENIIWNGTPVSPYNPEAKVYKCANNWYKDASNGKRFNIKTGTFMENTKIPLQKWFIAIWLLTSNKKGISSINLAEQLGTTQKTAWFLTMRIRKVFKIENEEQPMFEGIVESDESFFGGKNKNRHKNKKVEASQGRSFKDKTPILGVLQRGEINIVKCIVARNTKKDSIQPFIRNSVILGSVLISDEWYGYRGLNSSYEHFVVDHAKKQYVDYDNPEIHSNSIEGFWGIIKRGYNGVYNWWSPKHIQLYVDEFVFRFNTRKQPNSDRFNYVLTNSNIRTKYRDLINGGNLERH